MSGRIGGAVLVLLFGGAAWAGYAISKPEPPAPLPSPRPSPRPSPPPLGDLDGGAPSPPPKVAKPAAPDASKKDEPLRLTFEDLTQWDLDPKDVQVPQSILAYVGKEIDLVGYQLPYGDADDMSEFLLLRDLGSCCFGAAPLPHHVIECTFEGEKRGSYIPGPVRVRGRFRVEEHRRGQYLISVYAMEVSEARGVR